MSDAQDVLDRYLRAQEEKDLEALVSCWADDIEAVHPMRPDRSWSGIDTYRRAWSTIWANKPASRFEVISADVVGDRIYLQALVEQLEELLRSLAQPKVAQTDPEKDEEGGK